MKRHMKRMMQPLITISFLLFPLTQYAPQVSTPSSSTISPSINSSVVPCALPNGYYTDCGTVISVGHGCICQNHQIIALSGVADD